jgi:hypothetical protein
MTSLISNKRTKLLIFDNPVVLFSKAQTHLQFYNTYPVTSEEVLCYVIVLCPWKFLNAFEKLGKRLLALSCLSVRPSARMG